jgi:murein L,D-transpeptidase YcbB/YkuD
MLRSVRLAATVAAIAAIVACGRIQLGGPDKQDLMLEALRGVVTGRPPAYVAHDPEGARLWKQTRAFYENRQFTAAWIQSAKPRPQMDALIQALQAAGEEGLDPELYSADLLESRRKEASRGFLTAKGFDPKEAGALEVWLTFLYMKYASDLADGLADLARADKTWQIRPEKFDPRVHLEQALASGDIRRALLDLTPHVPEYQRLRAALADYRKRQAQGGWPKVPAMKLKPGQRSGAVAALARRLHASGDYSGPVADGAMTYGPELQDAVKRFQRRHGLLDDGVIGPDVVAALNVPIEGRISQIVLNLERWRWLPRDLGDHHILVNIPEMRLDVYERGSVPLTMRVVVGKHDTPTPIFNDRMTYIVFSPYWNVPPSIAEGETLPALMNDPGFLERNNMEVLDKAGNVLDPATIDLADPTAYRFRQRPGTSNSLGLVKFMFPNEFNVYLHDTPAESLFARTTRSFSHGCVRVEDPVALAKHVLRDQPEWTPERIREAMHAGIEEVVKLTEAVPVYLGYWTARVRPDNTVQFRKDVYQIDSRQTALLEDRLARLRRTVAAATVATRVKEQQKQKGKAAKADDRP